MSATRRGVGKRVPAVAAVMLFGLTILGAASRADAVPGPPYTPGASATALVGGTVAVACPPTPLPSIGGTTVGAASVSNASASCDAVSAVAQGQALINGTSISAFSASCASANGATGGAVAVPAGTTGTTNVTFPNGDTATLNEVAYVPAPIGVSTMVTRTAIRMTSGPANGAIIGRVICGGPYPLAVEVASPGAAVPDLPGQLTSGSGSSPVGPLLAVGVAILIAAQVIAVAMLLRRRATQP